MIFSFDHMTDENREFLFFVAMFSKRKENKYSVFLSSYKNTISESLGELEKAFETLACGSCSHSISYSLKLPLVFLFTK